MNQAVHLKLRNLKDENSGDDFLDEIRCAGYNMV